MITSEQNSVQYTLAGSGQVLPIPFAFLAASDIGAISTRAGLDTPLVLTTDYSISGGGSTPATGNLTMVAGVAGDIITIFRATTETQSLSLATLTTFPAKSVETAFDRLVMITQRLQAYVSRCVQNPLSSPSFLYTAAQKAGKLLAFDTLGNISLIDATAAPSDGNNTLVTATGSTTARTLATRFAEVANVKDYGAVGDGIVDDTLAIQAALNSGKYNIYFPAGTYIITRIDLTPVLDAFTGLLLGKRLYGEGSTATILKAKAGYLGTTLIFVGNANYATDGKYSVRNIIENLAVNDDAMLNNSSTSGIVLFGTYDNRLSNLKLGYAANRFDRINLNLSRGTYTTVIDSVHGGQLQISSSVQGDITTITVISCSWVFINLSKSVGIAFLMPIVQGTVGAGYQLNRIQIDDCFNVTFQDGDIEGSGVAFAITNSTGIYILRNNVALVGQYAGPTNSVFISATTCDRIIARDNVFMNWSPAGTYFTDGGANTKVAVMDFFGGFLCAIQYSRANLQALTSAVFTIVNFDSVEYATSGGLVTTGAAWHFTAPVKGTFRVSASVIIDGVAGDNAVVGIFKNGAEYKRSGYGGFSSNNQSGLQITALVPCALSDTIDIRVLSTNAAPNIVAAATAQFVSIELIPMS